MASNNFESCRIWSELSKTGILGKYPSSECPFYGCDGSSCRLGINPSNTPASAEIVQGLIAGLVEEAAHGPRKPRIPPFN